MNRIAQLSPAVVNKIAAGEVIERPASVVKELLENAIDAGATRIDAAVEKGGLEAIRVADDGRGIPREELPLAVASHATSKIRSADDLFRVGTLGFRGEALASIAAVSRFSIRSRRAEEDGGAQLEVVGGAAGEIIPVGCPAGTTVEVRNLFFNTPVRRKFLRTTQTEMSHVSEAFTRIALAYPAVHLVLRHQGRTLHDLPPTQELRERIARFFGADLADDLIPVSSGDGDARISGYVANPSQSRSNNRLQYLLLNGRAIRDRSLQHALSEAYRGLLLTGRYPICFLRLELSSELVDVNVHPTKHEVRFQDSGRLYSQLLGMLRMKFLSTDLTARASIPGDASGPAIESTGAAASRSRLVDWAKDELATRQQRLVDQSPSVAGPTATDRPGPLTLNRLDALDCGAAPASGNATQEASSHPSGPSFATEQAPAPPPTADRTDAAHAALPRALQIHNRYLVVETGEGMEVIDQHALHERILYEQLRDRALQGSVESQRLLVPEPVDLSATEAAAVLEQRELLGKLGVEVEPFGGETILVLAYPAMLSAASPGEVLRELVEQLVCDSPPPNRRDLFDDLLHMLACKAAVKYGDPLRKEEIEALLAQRHLAIDPHHCPHGRPTALVLTCEDLDRQFKRI